MSSTIVWIEDDTPVIESVVRPLRRTGYNIEEMHSVSEVLGKVEVIRSSDLILLDLLLPLGTHEPYDNRYSGLHLLEELRSQHNVSVPVVLFTVLPVTEVWESRFDELGIAKYIQKPVLPSVLKAEVEDVLSRSSK